MPALLDHPTPAVLTPAELNYRELERYIDRVSDRWQLMRAVLGGERVADLRDAPADRERGSEFVMILVSAEFDGTPWLERVYQAECLWDSFEMGSFADVHCYTPVEFERKLEQLPCVCDAVANGIELL